MSGNFDFNKLMQSIGKRRLRGIAVVLLAVAAFFVLGLIMGNDLSLFGGENGGSSVIETISTSETDSPDRATTTASTVTTDVTTKAPKTTTSHVTTTAKSTTSKTTTTAKTTTSTVMTTSPDYKEYHFRTKSQLNQHFDKHGSEFKKDFGYKTAAEYEKGASDVINNPNALYKTEKEDGDGVYYIEATNEFVILSTDGYIRTYFRPSGGKSYFDRQ